jgi:glycosyltransferase involved in cell wall biosynthesis
MVRQHGRWPLHTAFYARRPVRGQIAALIARTRPDVVFVHGIAGAAVIDGAFDPARVVLDLDNAEHVRFANMAAAMSPPRAWQYRLDVGLIRAWMRRALPGYGAVLLTSEEDVAAVREVAPTAKLDVLANGSDPRDPRPDPGGHEILFLGDLGYAPNADGLEWFRTEVLPRIPPPDRPVVRVVGKGTPRPGNDIVAVGIAPDLDAEWGRVVAMIAPIHSGAGTRLKVLDAFGAGVPVVGTALGVAGIGVVDGVHALVADDAASFAAAVTRALGDAALRQRLAVAANELVRAHYAWSTITSRHAGIVRAVAAHDGAQPR